MSASYLDLSNVIGCMHDRNEGRRGNALLIIVQANTQARAKEIMKERVDLVSTEKLLRSMKIPASARWGME